ncbi:hypothetical protein OZX74_05380 [Bifidobacterium sp. ESL0798]|uniref:hypothetical protein n=1 Tax=Bifidobacterium sp. ESL0798 TaxID=2983235 RepID=UPI0023F76C37|nr:hypothetical protein [Bifidobacterium sp. ESL0798]WEV73383.1 hypothetical protein OZX74_05380 [Bifidobacterium sp. ESL0798]
MTRLIFKNLMRTKETIIFLCFSLFPVLLPIAAQFNTKFMQFRGEKGSTDCLSFFGAVLNVNYQTILPMIVLIYLVVSSFYVEARDGTLFLYKDISRRKIFMAKVAALTGVVAVYVALLFVVSAAVYYLYMIHQPYASGTFLPIDADTAQSAAFDIVGTIFAMLLCVLVASVASQRFGVGITMLVAILYILVSQIAPLLDTLRYFLPNAYSALAVTLGFALAMGAAATLFIVYSAVLLVWGNHAYKTLEY